MKLRVLVALGLVGCRLPAADHERLGDQAYRAAQFERATAEYQAALRNGASARVLAKAGAAAIHARDYRTAVVAYRNLAQADESRVTEAALGLERVADLVAKERAGDRSIVAQAVLALRTVAPNRPLGRLARVSVSTTEIDANDLVGIMPAALAAANTASMVDSLMLRYAEALRITTACDQAARGYQAVLRRAERGKARGDARDGLANCGLVLGLDALASDRGELAERWFETVLTVETATERAWRAQIGRGDARVLLGDALGASVAYQAVIGAAGVSDTLRALAVSRLNALGDGSNPGAPTRDAGANGVDSE